MLFNLLLVVCTALMIFAAIALWSKTHNLGFLLGIAALYFWSIHGAWAIVYDLLGGDSGKHYHYLYDKLFPIYLDENYAWTLSLYTLFTLVACAIAYLNAKPRVLSRPDVESTPLVVSHPKMLLLACVSGGISYLIVRASLVEASSSGISGYHMTRLYNDSISFFTLHQILNRFALLPPAIGLAILASGPNARYIRGIPLSYALPAYVLTALVMYGFCMTLGNKNELLFSLLSGALFYVCNSPKPRIVLPTVIGLFALSGIAYIDFLRGIGLDNVWSELSFGEFANALIRISSSNESYGSHFSLYGCLEYEVPLTYGSSILSLVCSVIPRFLWPDRPPQIYEHYHNHVGAVDGQGYSIHHAAGWYLNFGIVGIFLGAIVLGLIWSWLYNNLHRVHLCRNRATQIFYSLAFFTFSAGIPNLVRAGPQAYKGVVIDAFVIPVLTVLFATQQIHRARQRTRSVPLGRLKQAL